MPNLLLSMKLLRSFIFSSVLGSSRFFSLYLVIEGQLCSASMEMAASYGSAGLEPVSVFE